MPYRLHAAALVVAWLTLGAMLWQGAWWQANGWAVVVVVTWGATASLIGMAEHYRSR